MPAHSPDHGTEEVLVRPPAHPVPALQGPFEESMVESVIEVPENDTAVDALTRRAMLLDSPYYERVVAGRWRQKPGEKYHPIWKLISQMAFGLHLLARNMAKSEEEVMKILQAHVDDIDSFLECTTEDFDLAQSDLNERLSCLNLPLQHVEVFDKMLQEPAFRASILEGNEKIEHIISRTKRFVKDSIKDVRKGIDATSVLETYVNGLSSVWERQNPEHEAVFVAMIGNVEGWRKAFMELHHQGNDLCRTLRQLAQVVNEMARRANNARSSRATVAASYTHQSSRSVSAAPSTARELQTQKPLPIAPGQSQTNSYQVSPKSRTSRTSRTSAMDQRDRSASARSHRNQSLELSQRGEPASSEHSSAQNSTEYIVSSTTVQKDVTLINSHVSTRNGRDQAGSAPDLPAELPADVPEAILRNAPVSTRNSLSSTLGLKKKDRSDHRISSIYYPKALGALLKVTQSSKVPVSPPPFQEKKDERLKSDSSHTDSDCDHNSVGATGETGGPSRESRTPTKDHQQQRALRSPAIIKIQASRKPSLQSPGLSSHPAVMAIIERPPPPVELPTERSPTRADGRSGIQSQEASRSRSELSVGGPESSLGEPGPEIDEHRSESDHEDHDRESMMIEDVADSPSAETPDLSDLVATPVQLRRRSHEKTPGEVQVYELGADEEAITPTATPKPAFLSPASGKQDPDVRDSHNNANSKSEADEEGAATPRVGSNDDNDDDAEEEEAVRAIRPVTRKSTIVAAKTNEETTRRIIAELEAMVPQNATLIAPGSPTEMQASRKQFKKLRPRTTVSNNTPVDIKATPGSSGVQQGLQSSWNSSTKKEANQDLKPKEPNNHSPKQSKKTRPLKLKLTKLYSKMVPAPSHRSEKDESQQATEEQAKEPVSSDRIEQVSTTPHGSPVHTSVSAGSEDSARMPPSRTSHRPSGSLAKSQLSPGPPAPGGLAGTEPVLSATAELSSESEPRRQHERSSSTHIPAYISTSKPDILTAAAGKGASSSLSADGKDQDQDQNQNQDDSPAGIGPAAT